MKPRKARDGYAPVVGWTFGGIVTHYHDSDDLRFREHGEKLYRECTLREAEEVLPRAKKGKKA
jgi:hypothetical protein